MPTPLSEPASGSLSVWVLADGQAGNESQALGVAEALERPFTVKPVRWTVWAGLHNRLRGASLLGASERSRSLLVPPWPDVVIAAGRRAAPVTRWIVRQADGPRRPFAVQVMDPVLGADALRDFGLVALPRHERVSPRGANILPVTGAPHRVTAARLARAREQLPEDLAGLNGAGLNGAGPHVAVLVGGATRKDRGFTPVQARLLAERATLLARRMGARLLVTTSRRTDPAAEEMLARLLPEDAVFHRYRPDAPFNPYFAFLALADAVVVTGESVSMCSEACGGSAPVHVFAPRGLVAAKHERLLDELYRLGCARPLEADPYPWTRTAPPLNAAREIAEEILKRLSSRPEGQTAFE